MQAVENTPIRFVILSAAKNPSEATPPSRAIDDPAGSFARLRRTGKVSDEVFRAVQVFVWFVFFVVISGGRHALTGAAT
jgi:hypothetical protein